MIYVHLVVFVFVFSDISKSYLRNKEKLAKRFLLIFWFRGGGCGGGGGGGGGRGRGESLYTSPIDLQSPNNTASKM